MVRLDMHLFGGEGALHLRGQFDAAAAGRPVGGLQHKGLAVDHDGLALLVEAGDLFGRVHQLEDLLHQQPVVQLHNGAGLLDIAHHAAHFGLAGVIGFGDHAPDLRFRQRVVLALALDEGVHLHADAGPFFGEKAVDFLLDVQNRNEGGGRQSSYPSIPGIGGNRSPPMGMGSAGSGSACSADSQESHVCSGVTGYW